MRSDNILYDTGGRLDSILYSCTLRDFSVRR